MTYRLLLHLHCISLHLEEKGDNPFIITIEDNVTKSRVQPIGMDEAGVFSSLRKKLNIGGKVSDILNIFERGSQPLIYFGIY